MAQRGRKSAAALSVAVTSLPGQRPEPPADLTPEQAEIWRAIVASRPAGYFGPETWPIVAAICKHVTTERALSKIIDAFDTSLLDDPAEAKRFDKLLVMRDRENKAINALSRSARLTKQSLLKAEKAATLAEQGAVRRPWEA